MSRKYDVVISGVAGLFPDCDDLEELMHKLLDGTDLVSVENCRWTPGDMDVPPATGKIKNPEQFDVTLFGIPRKLVEITDPNTRLTVMQGFRAVCDAGVNPSELSGSNTAVIASSFMSETEDENLTQNCNLGTYGIIANARAMQANRLSFFLNLKGPSTVCDATWCGGVQALQYAYDLVSLGLTEAAIVGSSSLLFKPQVSVHYQAMGRLCEDGVTRSFDSDASGYARSEGCVTMFLQRAQDARRSYGTLIAAKTIHRGLRSNFFLDMDPEHLEGFLRDIYRDAGIDPKDLAYYEASGTASKKLDAKELNVAAKVFLPGRSKPLLVGSVKSNLGHTEGASAMVSLAKALIALDRGVIPPNLHYASPNPDVPALLSGQMKVVTEVTELDGDIIGITDIGISGTTLSHVIVKRNPLAKPPLPNHGEMPPDNMPRIVLLSDRNEDNLRNNLKRLSENQIDEEFCCLLNNLQREGVRGQLFRGYCVLNGHPNSYNKVQDFEWNYERKPIWFMFSGMGSQWPRMGKQLMKFPVFAQAVHKCHDILLPKGINLLDILTNDNPKLFDSILNCFVGIAAVQIGLVEILKEVGVHPDGMIGHSVGELGCGYADGCLTLEQMILSAYARGKASIEAPLIKGTMAAVGMGYNKIKDQLPESIDVACHNSKTSCTLSGPAEDMEKYIKTLKSQNVFAKLVNVANIAYHSRYIKPAGALLLDYLKPIIAQPALRSSKWLSSSNPENEWESNLSKYSSAEYYTNNLLSSVLFEEVSRHVPDDAVLIEIAPHSLLQAIVKKSLPRVTHIPLTSRFDEDNLMYLLSALGKLYLSGVPVDVQRLYPPVAYPVSRGTQALSPFFGWQNIENFEVTFNRNDRESGWKDISISMREDKFAMLAFHKVRDSIVLPQGFYLKKAVHLYWKVKAKRNTIVLFESLKFSNNAEIPLMGASFDIDLRLLQGTGLFYFTGIDSIELASGKLQIIEIPQWRSLERSISALSKKTGSYVHYDGKDVLNFMGSHGLTLENKFDNIRSVEVGDTGLSATIHWDGNMITFLTGLLTLVSFFRTKLSNTLHLVSEVNQLIVDFPLFNDLDKGNIEVFYDEKMGSLQCSGILLFLPKTKEVSGNGHTRNSSLEVHQFAPYDFGEIGSGQSAVSICHQLIMENRILPNDTRTQIKTLCVGENLFFDGLSSLTKICHQLQMNMVSEQGLIDQGVPLINGEIGWIVSSKTICRESIQRIQSVAPKSFILMPFISGNPKDDGMFQVFTFSSSFEKYALYSFVSHSSKNIEKVNLSDNYLQVLESKLIRANERNIQDGLGELVYLVGNLDSLSSILGVLDETSRLPHYNLLRFFFADEKENLDEYFGRINNDLKMNVIWNGALGSLKAFSRKSATSQSNGASLVYPLSSIMSITETTALGLNLSDVTGSLDSDEIGALDYANSVTMGIGVYDRQTRIFTPDDTFKWDKPSQWTVSEAATVPLIYSLAMSIIQEKKGTIVQMKSILVNQGLLLLSQAIIHLLQNEPVEIYVTVHGDEEKKQLMKLFPKLKPENIFDATPTFHVAIMQATEGSGVDKVVNNFKEPEMVKPSAYSVAELGILFQVSLKPVTTKSTMGMLAYSREVSAIGISSETLLKLNRDKKVEIRDAVATAISEGRVQTFAKTSIPQQATNIEAIKSLKSVKAKVVSILENKQDVAMSRTLRSDGNYVIVNDEDSNSTRWLNLTNWLVGHGVRDVTVVLRDTTLTGLNKLRLESLKHKFNSLALMMKPMSELSTQLSVNSFIRAMDAAQNLSSVFILSSKNSTLMELINESLEKEECKCELVFFGYGAENICERRSRRGLPSLCVRVGSDERDFKFVLEHLDSHFSEFQRNPIVTVRTHKDAVSTEEQSRVPSNFAELQKLLLQSPRCCSLKEITSSSPRKMFSREVNPVFVFPGLRPQNMKEITRKVLYPVFEVRLPKNVTSISNMAEEVSRLMSSSGRNMYTLVAEDWSCILALHVAAALESQKKIVRLILIDDGPSDVIEWSTMLMNDPITLISKYIDATYDVKLNFKNCSTWDEKVNGVISESPLTPEEKRTTIECLDLLRRRLQGVISSKPPTYKLLRPCYLFKCRSFVHSGQYGLEEYLRTEAVVRSMDADTDTEIADRVANEINALALYETEDAANPPREDYLKVAFIKGQTKATA